MVLLVRNPVGRYQRLWPVIVRRAFAPASRSDDTSLVSELASKICRIQYSAIAASLMEHSKANRLKRSLTSLLRLILCRRVAAASLKSRCFGVTPPPSLTAERAEAKKRKKQY